MLPYSDEKYATFPLDLAYRVIDCTQRKRFAMLHHRIQDRVEKRLRRRNHLFIHLALTLLLVILIAGLGVSQQIEDTVIPAVVLLFVARALWFVYQESGTAILHQEIEHERYDDMDEKPKHHLAIGDDGELTELPYDGDWQEKPKHAE
jgi:hypothetical protein